MSELLKFPVSLWSPSESTSITLIPRDIFLCKSTEFFLASYADTIDFENEPKIVQGQVGIRCIYCARAIDMREEDKHRSMAFPRSIEDMASCLRSIGLTHFVSCPLAQFMPNIVDQNEAFHLRQLSIYCSLKCDKFNIVSRAPQLSGLFVKQPPIRKPNHVRFNSLDDFLSFNITEKGCVDNQSARSQSYDQGSYHETVMYPGRVNCTTSHYDPSFCNADSAYTHQRSNRQSLSYTNRAANETGHGIRQGETATFTKSRLQQKRILNKNLVDDVHAVVKKARFEALDAGECPGSKKKLHYEVESITGHQLIPPNDFVGPGLKRVDDTSVDINEPGSPRKKVERMVEQFSAIELFNLAMEMLEHEDEDARLRRAQGSSLQYEDSTSLVHNSKEVRTLNQADIQSSSLTMPMNAVVKERGDDCSNSLTDTSSSNPQKIKILDDVSFKRSSIETLQRSTVESRPLSMINSPGDHDFPYFKDVFGSWVCRFCCYVPFSNRAFGSIWQANEPPSHQFIKSHLLLCNNFIHNKTVPTIFSNDETTQTRSDSVGGSPKISIQQCETINQTYSEPCKTGRKIQNIESQLKSRIKLREKQALTKKNMLSMTRENDAVAASISFLTQYETIFSVDGVDTSLISDDDHELISDFMFHIIKQLRICALDEADQKGRGKTRATFDIGFMGVQCNHCKAKPRKFFWTNVSRFNNSFSSEIISHVMSCCPADIQKHLAELKKVHSEQMSYLPRGSQKLFFDRLWERLHNNHKTGTNASEINESGNLYLNDDSLEVIKRLSVDPLVFNHDTILEKENCFSFGSTTAVKGVCLLLSLKRIIVPPILLALDEDFLFLPQYDCFIRNNLEVFCADDALVKSTTSSSGLLIEKGRIGIRCAHCVGFGGRYDENATIFPESLDCVLQSAHSIATNHLGRCPCLPKITKDAFLRMKSNYDEFPSSLAMKYYSSAGMALGLVSAPNGEGLVLSKCGHI